MDKFKNSSPTFVIVSFLIGYFAICPTGGATEVDDVTQQITRAVVLVCKTKKAQSVQIKDLEAVSLFGNGKLNSKTNTFRIQKGSPIIIGISGLKPGTYQERAIGRTPCNLEVTPSIALRDQWLTIKQFSVVSDPFLSKVLEGDFEAVRKMVEAGQDVNVQAPVSPLMVAAAKGDLDIVKYLLDRGAQINAQAQINRKTALHMAVEFGQVKAAGLLLDRGADIELMDIDGYTPLWGAAYQNRPELIEFLLKRGANLNHLDRNGNCALSPAAANGADQAIRKLIELGLNPDHKNKFGRTPIFDAIDQRRESTVRLLIEYKVDLNVRTRSGQTPLLRSEKAGDSRITGLLENSGAQ